MYECVIRHSIGLYFNLMAKFSSLNDELELIEEHNDENYVVFNKGLKSRVNKNIQTNEETYNQPQIVNSHTHESRTPPLMRFFNVLLSISLIILAALTFYFIDFKNVLMNDSRVINSWFYSGVVFFILGLLLAIFCIVYQQIIKKVDYETETPWAVPSASFCFVMGVLCSTIAIWPVYGWGSILILLVFAFGIFSILILQPF